MRQKPLAAALLLALLLLAGPVAAPPAGAQDAALLDFTTRIDAEAVMQHVRALAVDIGARPLGTEAEARAAAYIADALESYGYAVEVQEFAVGVFGFVEPATSRNVIAAKAGDDRTVVVGAHIDSAEVGTGAGDNASGVAAMLAAAEALADVELQHTVAFVGFGAEEEGSPSGADFYVTSLGPGIQDVIAMLNIDSVGVGTNMYVYAGAHATGGRPPEVHGGPTWVRDLALDLAAEMGLPFGTSPPETWDGYTGVWSDHFPFHRAGVPIAYFEAWYWEGGGDPWWGQETPQGTIMHTERDVIDNVVPEKVEMTAELLAATTAALASGSAVAATSP